MMSTGVESFDKAAELGAIYPFQGSEVYWFYSVPLFWLGWHIWQLRNESRECDVEIKEMKGQGAGQQGAATGRGPHVVLIDRAAPARLKPVAGAPQGLLQQALGLSGVGRLI